MIQMNGQVMKAIWNRIMRDNATDPIEVCITNSSSEAQVVNIFGGFVFPTNAQGQSSGVPNNYFIDLIFSGAM